MRPRIFWTLLASFALVIVLGICGMLGFIGLVLSGVWQPSSVRESFDATERGYGVILGDYYVANGNSWLGVEQRLDDLPFLAIGDYVILDTSGSPVAGDVAVRRSDFPRTSTPARTPLTSTSDSREGQPRRRVRPSTTISAAAIAKR